MMHPSGLEPIPNRLMPTGPRPHRSHGFRPHPVVPAVSAANRRARAEEVQGLALFSWRFADALSG